MVMKVLTQPVLFGNMEGWELTSSNQGFKLESNITSSPKSWTKQMNAHKLRILWPFYYFLLDKMSVCFDMFSPCSSCHGILVQTPQFLFNKSSILKMIWISFYPRSCQNDHRELSSQIDFQFLPRSPSNLFLKMMKRIKAHNLYFPLRYCKAESWFDL